MLASVLTKLAHCVAVTVLVALTVATALCPQPLSLAPVDQTSLTLAPAVVLTKTAATSGATWTITFTNTVTFASANAMRYFFNAGGLIKLDVAKSSTGATGDPEWNDLATTLCGDIYFSGVAASHTIAGVAYTGTTKIGGTGTPNTLSTATGRYALTPGAAATIIYKQFADTAPYTANFIQHSVALDATQAILTFTTLWSASDGDPITGGTASSGATPGTAATTICTYFPPSTTYLSNSWGTPTVAATTV